MPALHIGVQNFLRATEHNIPKFGTLFIALTGAGALWLATARHTHAIPSPEQHEMSGVVQRVDRDAITILPEHASKPVVFTSNKDTKFIRDSAPANPTMLHKGTAVTIRCSHPIFGKPLLYRVSWRSSGVRREH